MSNLDLDQQNDAEEYMISLVDQIRRLLSFREWAELVSLRQICIRICRECHVRIKRRDPNWILKGELSRTGPKYQKLDEILHFQKPDQDRCDKCDKRTKQDAYYAFLNPPPILIVHVPALVQEDNVNLLEQKVAGLEQHLVFSCYPTDIVSEDGKDSVHWASYQLYGIILLGGDDVTSGHYVCAFEQRQQGHWLWFNDTINAPAEELTRRELEARIKKAQEKEYRIFMMMYRKLFQMPMLQSPGAISSTALQSTRRPQQPRQQPQEQSREQPQEQPKGPVGQVSSDDDNMETLRGQPDDWDEWAKTSGSEQSQKITFSKPDLSERKSAPTENVTQQSNPTHLSTPIDVIEDLAVSAHPETGDATTQPIPGQRGLVEAAPGPSISPPGVRQTRSKTRAARAASQKPEDVQTEPVAPTATQTRTKAKTTTQSEGKQTKSRAKKRAQEEALAEGEIQDSAPTTKGSRAKPGTKSKSRAKTACENEAVAEDEVEETTASVPKTKRSQARLMGEAGDTKIKGRAKRAREEEALADDEQEVDEAPVPKKARTRAKSEAAGGKKRSTRATKEIQIKGEEQTTNSAPAEAEAESSTKPAGRPTRRRTQCKE
ncbi:hypothetical protein TSTA_045170 [Talaromyces stipitatus ATCC 10500]|uniref:USP domain-containing protein n=1 Tax=Talaromyces stipitatus (strain ATCC 10500 / CBS 375.48 / QM 6759 / NRRL 1006) TaxID=441959 RepID=B8MLD9_TALSN|nr:uncharacterized protein TSTA_045170 [Talaromyces stipitatus ATCC 10500]EED15054.1 hypothetical protein TSTA_045170 [Talaromyces stipitatus ATCC 10500]